MQEKKLDIDFSKDQSKSDVLPGNEKTKRPPSYSNSVEHFLDNLRDSGAINMLGASPYLKRNFRITKNEADACLIYWMQSFSNR